jgi:hypothetical protein
MPRPSRLQANAMKRTSAAVDAGGAGVTLQGSKYGLLAAPAHRV